MQIYPDGNVKHGSAAGFEIDNIYVGLETIAHILSSIDGVAKVRKRRLFGKWEGIHIWFQYMDKECVVIEPFGDNSRYWIGLKNPDANGDLDLKTIQAAFESYTPNTLRKILGGLLSFKFLHR